MYRKKGHLLARLLILILAVLELAPRPQAWDLNPKAESRWILVLLPAALGEMREDGSFPLQTGFERVDALIYDLGIHRIEYALPVSARYPKHPEALRRHGLDRTYRFHVPAGVDVYALARAFDGLADVVYAEPDYVGTSTATPPNDTLFPDQWHFDNIGQSGGTFDADIDAPEAWDLSTGSSSVVIGIADSGIDVDHTDLDGTLWVNSDEVADNGIDDDGNGYVDDVHGWNFATGTGDVNDTDGHGTAVSSLAVAETNNGQGIAGVCWECRVMSTVRADNTHSDYADSVIWAADHGAQVVNGSWGDPLVGSDTLASAVSYIADLGVVHVNSAGNLPTSWPSYPARYVETIAVAGTTSTDERWRASATFGSSAGPQVDVCAAAQDVLAATNDGGYGSGDGTSAAAPQAAGLAGLVLSVNRSAGWNEIRHLIRSGAEDQVGDPAEDTPGFDNYHGWGRINADRTLRAAQSAITLQVEGKTATRLTLTTPNPIADSYDFARGDLSAFRENPYGVEVGELLCLENDSTDADTLGDEDTDIPAPGEGFFYVARFNAAPGAGSYGGSSRHRDRLVFDQATDASWIYDGEQENSIGGQLAAAGDVNGDGFDDLAIGAFRYDHTFVDAGRVRVFHGSSTGPASDASWTFSGDQEGGNFGSSLAGAGDVNGDGFDDLIVAAVRYDAGETNEGRAYLFYGSETGLQDSPSWTFDTNQEGAQLMVGSAGDVNGDGFDDLLVGSPGYDSVYTNEGRAFLFFGGTGGPGSAPDWTFDGGQENANLTSFSGLGAAGDVNADGYGDILLGATLYDNGEVDEGRAYLFLGSSIGPGASPDVTFEEDDANARLGSSVAGAGDIDADGFDDILFGARDYGTGGAVFLHLGSSTGPDTTADWTFQSDQANAQLHRVDTAGDIDGDGFADVVVGAVLYDARRQDEGIAWLFRGSSTGLSSDPVWIRSGRQAGARYSNVSSVGDLNGDGSPEFGVAARPFDVGEKVDAGRTYIYEWPLSMDTPHDCSK